MRRVLIVALFVVLLVETAMAAAPPQCQPAQMRGKWTLFTGVTEFYAIRCDFSIPRLPWVVGTCSTSSSGGSSWTIDPNSRLRVKRNCRIEGNIGDWVLNGQMIPGGMGGGGVIEDTPPEGEYQFPFSLVKRP